MNTLKSATFTYNKIIFSLNLIEYSYQFMLFFYVYIFLLG